MTRIVLAGAEIFDGSGSEAAVTDVAIEGDKIVEVGNDLTGDDVRDMSGKLIVPGLIDCHAHALFNGMDVVKTQQQPFSLQFFEAERNLKTILDSGITSMRDAGGIDLGVKTAVEEGLIEGPRLKISITVLSQTGGHADWWNVHGDCQRLMVPHPGRPDTVVDGVEGMRKRVREIIRAGSDTIKICSTGGVMSTRDDPRHSQFALEELQVCVDEARAAGQDVLSHAQGAAGIKNALRAGVHSIEHGIFIDDECIDLFLETGAWLVPTLLAPVALIESIDAGMRVAPESEAKARSVVDKHLNAIARAHSAGVNIAMGTDGGVFAHGQAPRELVLMMEAGMSAQEALIASTSNAAKLMRIEDEVGTIEAGKAADLLVLGGDAWDLTRFNDNLEDVMQAGEFVARTV